AVGGVPDRVPPRRDDADLAGRDPDPLTLTLLRPLARVELGAVLLRAGGVVGERALAVVAAQIAGVGRGAGADQLGGGAGRRRVDAEAHALGRGLAEHEGAGPEVGAGGDVL